MISIDWQSLYHWPGFDFWGIILGLIGSFFSVLFAYLASRNSRKAADAAADARRSMALADAASQLALVQQLLVEVRLRTESSQWEYVSERCESIRVILAPVLTTEFYNLNPETMKSLVGLQSQMASLQKKSDEIRHRGAEIDLVKIKSILAKQAEITARAVADVRRSMEIPSNV